MGVTAIKENSKDKSKDVSTDGKEKNSDAIIENQWIAPEVRFHVEKVMGKILLRRKEW